MSKLNPRAKEFVPRTSSQESGDVIFIVRKGKVEEIRVEDTEEYNLNVLKAEKPAERKVYVNHFFGWTFTQVADFLRSATREQVLDILYEAMRQKSYLTGFGVLLVYAFQTGIYHYHCIDRTREAFNRFFQSDDNFDYYRGILEREIRWAQKLASGGVTV